MKKYVVIKNDRVIGEYKDSNEAMMETLKVEELGSFVIEECHTPDED